MFGGIDLEPHIHGNHFQVGHFAGHFRPLIPPVERQRSGFDTLNGESGFPNQDAIEENSIITVRPVDGSGSFVEVIFQKRSLSLNNIKVRLDRRRFHQLCIPLLWCIAIRGQLHLLRAPLGFISDIHSRVFAEHAFFHSQFSVGTRVIFENGISVDNHEIFDDGIVQDFRLVQHHGVGTDIGGLSHRSRIGHPAASVGMTFAFHILKMPLCRLTISRFRFCHDSQTFFDVLALFRIGDGNGSRIESFSRITTRFQSGLPESFIVYGRGMRRSGTTSF